MVDQFANRAGGGRWLLATLACTVLTTRAIAAENYTTTIQPEVVSEGTRATLIRGESPAYPAPAASRGIEGWVIVSFVVTPQGDTDEITVLESSAPGYFDGAAIRAVESRKYVPATWNGVPVTEAARSMTLVFTMEGGQGRISRRFAAYLKRIYAALEADDLEAAQKTIETVERQEKRLLAEVCYLDAVKGDYWLKQQDLARAMHHYARALVIADNVASHENLVMLLRKAVLVNAQLGKVAATLDYYEQLLAADPTVASDDTYSVIAERTKALVAGPEPIATYGEIESPCASCPDLAPLWRHQLIRDRFSIGDVSGELYELKLLCGNSYVSLAYEPDVLWKVEREWGECDLHILGEAGSTFTLVEHGAQTGGSPDPS